VTLSTDSTEKNKVMDDKNSVLQLMEDECAYSSELGAMYEGDSKELLEQLPDESIDLIVTSPPFALQHEKEYGNEDQSEYNDWFMSFIPEIRRVLAPHGSLVIEIGGAFKRGWPERSTYQFDLLTRLVDEDEGQLHLAQDFYWFNPAKIPGPIEWVNVRKIRVTDAVTHIWWLSKDINKDSAVEEGEKPIPEASNQRVLTEYSDSQKKLIDTGEYNDGKRSSGWDVGSESFANDNDGAIPKNLLKEIKGQPPSEALEDISAVDLIEAVTEDDSLEDLSAADLMRALNKDTILSSGTATNLIEASNTASNTHYLTMCREFNYDHHPARFPRQIPEFFINFLTPNPPYDDWDDGYLDRPIVLDIFGGSNLTGRIAENEERNWLSFEKEPEYIETSQFRFLEESQIRSLLSQQKEDVDELIAEGVDAEIDSDEWYLADSDD